MGRDIKILPVVVLVLTTIIVTNLAVIFRYILESPLAWSEETVRYLFIWLIFIGAAIAYKEGVLVEINMLTELAKGNFSYLLEVVRMLLCLIWVIFLAYESSIIWISQFATGETSPAMELPIWIVTSGLVLGAFMWLVFVVIDSCRLFSKIFQRTGST